MNLVDPRFRQRSIGLLVVFACMLGGCEQEPPARAPTRPAQTRHVAEPIVAADAFRQVHWDELVPDGYRPDDILAEYDLSQFTDDDPRAAEVLARIRAAWDAAPVVPEMDGDAIRVPGYVVPLEAGQETIDEFLLVPYYGACIHVPPPPANQTILVRTGKTAHRTKGLFEAVWVSGTLHVTAATTGLAQAGYVLDAAAVEPYAAARP